MTPQIASFVFVIGVIGLFLLDRDRKVNASWALCLPLIWLWITSSRSLAEWLTILQLGHPLAADQANMYAEGTPLDRNVLIGLMVLAIIVLVKRGCFWELLRANRLIMLFLLFGAASAFWSDYPDITIRRLFKAVGCVLMMMVVLSERDRESAMRRLFVWAGFLLIPHSVLLVKYYPAIGRSYNRWTWLVSFVGVTTHKNSLGGICEIYGIAFLWHFLTAYRNHQLPHRTRHLIAHGVALAMVGWLFMQANSVTAQSSFLLAAMLLFATGTRAAVRKRWLVHVIVFALIAVPFATLFMGIGGGALQDMGRDSSLTGRANIWPRVIALVHNPVIGTGFESFWLGSRLDAMQRYQRGLNESHNGFLEMWTSLGWIGVLFLAAMIVAGYRNIIAAYRRDPNAGRFRLAYFLSVIVSSFTEAAFRTESISWIAFLLITMSAPSEGLQKRLPAHRVTEGALEPEPLATLAGGSGLRYPAAVMAPTSNQQPRRLGEKRY
jgi:O-antigen ligase